MIAVPHCLRRGGGQQSGWLHVSAQSPTFFRSASMSLAYFLMAPSSPSSGGFISCEATEHRFDEVNGPPAIRQWDQRTLGRCHTTGSSAHLAASDKFPVLLLLLLKHIQDHIRLPCTVARIGSRACCAHCHPPTIPSRTRPTMPCMFPERLQSHPPVQLLPQLLSLPRSIERAAQPAAEWTARTQRRSAHRDFVGIAGYHGDNSDDPALPACSLCP